MKKTASAHVYNTIQRYPKILKTPTVEKAMGNLKCWMALRVITEVSTAAHIYLWLNGLRTCGKKTPLLTVPAVRWWVPLHSLAPSGSILVGMCRNDGRSWHALVTCGWRNISQNWGNKLLAFHLDYKQAAKKDCRGRNATFHRCCTLLKMTSAPVRKPSQKETSLPSNPILMW